MDSIEETLRKSREVEQKYKQFLERKKQHDASMKQTQSKIENTLKMLSDTKDTVKKIDNMYVQYEEMMEKVFDAALDNLKKNGGWIAADQNYQPWIISQKQLANLLKTKTKIVFITGAGMSAASGIPTFRGQGGFWNKDNNKQKDIQPQTILTLKYYNQYPFQTWQWLSNFYKLKMKSVPNKGHTSLAQICQQLLLKGKQVSIITQNIDNFHVQAQQMVLSKLKVKPSKKCNIYAIHGNIKMIRCDECTKKSSNLSLYEYEKWIKQLEKGKNAQCLQCKSNLRPHIMFFDEFYDEVIHRSDSCHKAVEQADLVLIIGTTLSTGLVSNLASSAVNNDLNGNKVIVQINPQCQIRKNKVRRIELKSEEVLVNTKNFLIG